MARWDVLIVEDDDDTRESLSEILGDEGLHIRAFPRAEEAADFLLAGAVVRLVIADARLPGASGTTLLQMLRSSPGLRHIPLVLLSADRAAVIEAERLGANAAYTKPIELDDLLEAVHTLLPAATAAT